VDFGVIFQGPSTLLFFCSVFFGGKYLESFGSCVNSQYFLSIRGDLTGPNIQHSLTPHVPPDWASFLPYILDYQIYYLNLLHFWFSQLSTPHRVPCIIPTPRWLPQCTILPCQLLLVVNSTLCVEFSTSIEWYISLPLVQYFNHCILLMFPHMTCAPIGWMYHL